ncbi:PhnA-like protein [Azospirillum sp. RWY-5-1]|uniref:PhnA-like protein n=1 Tax=Azospirillum oleiclasticum TaxID=2735135 RepID=A0ABX2TBD2_9PROT|nr:PhnA-like protein [Azospirillum oleiclasticum]NYZ14172.1 PhnA-like protein [Azospirillum oleiclasticum]NYZ21656.1 PhnA-like protein [Azospirillum oleiclasticum]
MRENVYEASPRADAVPDVTVHAGVHRRVSWAAVFAGVAITLALQILLSMLGLGIGFTTIDPSQTGGTPQASTLGTSAGVWWTVSYMIALAAGGYVAARLAGVAVRGDGVLHGVVTWAFALLVSAWLVTTAVGSVLGSTATMLGSVASGVGSTVSQTVQQAAPEALRASGLTPDELRNQAEQLLRPEGEQQSPENARTELATLVGRMASGDQSAADQARDRAAQIVAQQAGIPEDQARQRVQELEQTVRQAGQQVQQTATNAAEATTDTLAQAGIWGTVALVLGAVAGMIGGAAGTRRPEDMLVTSAHR